MFDFGLSMGELMVIALVALIVVGPKDLPRMLRMLGRFVTKLRGMAGEFQRHLDSAIREAGIDEVKKEMTNFTATADINKHMTDEFRKQSSEIKSMIDAPAKAAEPPATPAEAAAPAEPAPEAALAEPAPPAPKEETKADA
jgi:sec-independent protein translocase protein TatB